jgi:PAT family beta-lactamase induction signal transducer AmpG
VTLPFIEAYKSRRVGMMLPLGLMSGLPNPLVTGTLTAWMATAGVDLHTIGLFGLMSLPYNLKFLWAPLLDRYAPPFLGRRRGYLLLSQLALSAGLFFVSAIDPNSQPSLLAWAIFGLTFCSASQDIVSDAYRTDATRENERASAAAIFVLGYRVALLVAGGGALMLSDQVSWQVVYRLMAGLMLLGPVVTFFSPEPEVVPEPPPSLYAAVWQPLKEFFTRKGVLFSLIVVLTYKVGDSVAGHMLTPFLMEVGFSRTEIGGVQKVFGLVATIVGTLLGGGFTARLGLRRALLVFGILQAVANLFYAWLAHVGQSHLLLVTAIGVDNLMNGLGTAAFVALLMSLSDQRYTAFQYALLSSAMSVVGRLFGASGGYIAEGFGWPTFFVLTTLLATPAIVVLWLRPLAEATKSVEAEEA